MNEGFAPIAEEVGKARTIAVLSHVRPDGDAIGSQLALTLSLSSLGKIVAAWNEDGLPEAFSFLSKSERSEEHTSELQSHSDLVCRLLLEKKKKKKKTRSGC